jgi:hypothetical protein
MSGAAYGCRSSCTTTRWRYVSFGQRANACAIPQDAALPITDFHKLSADIMRNVNVSRSVHDFRLKTQASHRVALRCKDCGERCVGCAYKATEPFANIAITA